MPMIVSFPHILYILTEGVEDGFEHICSKEKDEISNFEGENEGYKIQTTSHV